MRLLQDLGAPKAENGTQGHVGVVTRGGRGAGAGPWGAPRPLLVPEQEAEWGLQVHQALVPPCAPVASPEKQ